MTWFWPRIEPSQRRADSLPDRRQTRIKFIVTALHMDIIVHAFTKYLHVSYLNNEITDGFVIKHQQKQNLTLKKLLGQSCFLLLEHT